MTLKNKKKPVKAKSKKPAAPKKRAASRSRTAPRKVKAAPPHQSGTGGWQACQSATDIRQAVGGR